MQILRKSGVEPISTVGVCLLTSFCIHLWFFIISRSWGMSSNFWQHCLYLLHLPLERESVVIERVGPLCLPWEALFSLLGKLWVHSPSSIPPIIVCPSLFPITCSFWLNSCPFHGGRGRGNLCKNVSSLLLGVGSSCVCKLMLGRAPNPPCCTLSELPALMASVK